MNVNMDGIRRKAEIGVQLSDANSETVGENVLDAAELGALALWSD